MELNINEKRVLKVPQHIKYLSDVFAKHGIEIFLVGGFVRNSLLSLPVTDIDIASCKAPQKIIDILKENSECNVIPKALDFGTIQIDLMYKGQKYSFEHTTFRNDFYHEDGSHRPKSVSFTHDMKLDAMRRDFTINAIYYSIQNKKIHDPLMGLDDLKNQTIKATKSDARQTLSDDGLRILRMARFAAEFNFKIDASLFQAAKEYVYYLADISAERKWNEIKKIMLADIKYPTYIGAYQTPKHKRGMIVLNQVGALRYTFPCMLEGKGIMQNKIYHKYDVLNHGLHAYYESEPYLDVRLTALLHDIGKPATVKKNGKMVGHDIQGACIAKQALEQLRVEKLLMQSVCLLIKNHMFDLHGNAKPNTIKKRAAHIGFDNMIKLAKVRRADFIGSGRGDYATMANTWEQIVQKMRQQNTPENIQDMEISGKELMEFCGLKEGERVGELLKRLHNLTIVKPKQNKKKLLLSHAKKMVKEEKYKQ